MLDEANDRWLRIWFGMPRDLALYDAVLWEIVEGLEVVCHGSGWPLFRRWGQALWQWRQRVSHLLQFPPHENPLALSGTTQRGVPLSEDVQEDVACFLESCAHPGHHVVVVQHLFDVLDQDYARPEELCYLRKVDRLRGVGS